MIVERRILADAGIAARFSGWFKELPGNRLLSD
jgi:hypothetical protein